MRYEAGDCAIMISIKTASNYVLKLVLIVGHIFAKNHTRPKAIIHGFWVKIQPTAKQTSLECSIHADCEGLLLGASNAQSDK